jgi:hypothetical protein
MPGGKDFGNRSFASLILPAGTLVKHGITSDVLSSILSKGVLPSGSVSAGMLRDRYEKQPIGSGVYVANSYAAYASALISFTSKVVLILTNGLPFKPELIPLPIVLNIRLDDDCMSKADEDYAQFLGRVLEREGNF